MEKEEISIIIKSQHDFFATGKTFDINFRIGVLKKLRSLIIEHEPEIVSSLWEDFHKPEFEVIATESRFVIKELNHIIKNLRNWSRKKKVRTPIVHFLSHSYVSPQPYGQVLVLSPWNFPACIHASGRCSCCRQLRYIKGIPTGTKYYFRYGEDSQPFPKGTCGHD
jgi:aldehyde dehydrogenase (NAD+)